MPRSVTPFSPPLHRGISLLALALALTLLFLSHSAFPGARAEDVEEEEPSAEGCEAVLQDGLEAEDFADFVNLVQSANLEAIIVVKGLVEDSNIELALEEEIEQSDLLDLDEGVDEVRTACANLTFNGTVASTTSSSLCFAVVSISTANVSFEPLDVTLPVCRASVCSPDSALTDLACPTALAYLAAPDGSDELECEEVSIFCEICSGCFMDQIAIALDISPDYVVVILVIVILIVLVAVFICIARRNQLGDCSPRGKRGKKGPKSVTERYYAQFDRNLEMTDGSKTGGAGTALAQQKEQTEHWKKMITNIYLKHRPTKMDELPSVLARYRGQEEQLYGVLSRKYEEA